MARPKYFSTITASALSTCWRSASPTSICLPLMESCIAADLSLGTSPIHVEPARHSSRTGPYERRPAKSSAAALEHRVKFAELFRFSRQGCVCDAPSKPRGLLAAALHRRGDVQRFPVFG